MRHHVSQKKLGREKGQRDALLASMARSLVLYGRIETTEARAKALRPFIEKLVTKAKPGSIAARRLVESRLGNPRITKKLIDEIAPRYQERAGGYTRITKLPVRQHDASPMALIEFV